MQMTLDNGRLRLDGEVTVQTLDQAALRRFSAYCRQGGWQVLDLGGVSRADSACLSLLLTAKRLFSGSLNIEGLPESVQALAELYEIESWITA